MAFRRGFVGSSDVGDIVVCNAWVGGSDHLPHDHQHPSEEAACSDMDLGTYKEIVYNESTASADASVKAQRHEATRSS